MATGQHAYLLQISALLGGLTEVMPQVTRPALLWLSAMDKPAAR
jgi:hypothetical protein